jgi:integrase
MAKVTQRGNSYSLSWYEGGKRRKQIIGRVGELSPQAIRAAELSKELEITTGAQVKASDPQLGPYFGAWAADYLIWHRSQFEKASPAHHRRVSGLINNHFVPFFESYRLGEIKPQLVLQYLERRRIEGDGRTKFSKPLTAATLNKELTSLKAIINRAIEDQVWEVARAPIAKMKKLPEVDSRPPHKFEQADLERLFQHPHWPSWMLMASTGLRRGEYLALKWTEVFDNKIHVISTSAARTKSKKWRPLPINSDAAEALAELRLRYATDKRTDGYVAPRIWPESLTRCMKKALAALGLSGTLHALRHTFASRLSEMGVVPVVIKDLCGHSSLNVTQRYMHSDQDQLAEATRAIERARVSSQSADSKKE